MTASHPDDLGTAARRDDDVPAELQARVEDARRDLEQAVADLRATMSDEQARDEFGIDVDRLLP